MALYHTIPHNTMHIDLCHTRFVPWDMDHMIQCIIIQHHTIPCTAILCHTVPFLPLSPPPTPEAPITGGRSQTLLNKHFLEQSSVYLYLESLCTKYVVYLCQIQYMFATKLSIPPCPTVVVCEPSTLGPIWVKFHTCPLIRLQAKRHSLHIVHFWIR